MPMFPLSPLCLLPYKNAPHHQILRKTWSNKTWFYEITQTYLVHKLNINVVFDSNIRKFAPLHIHGGLLLWLHLLEDNANISDISETWVTKLTTSWFNVVCSISLDLIKTYSFIRPALISSGPLWVFIIVWACTMGTTLWANISRLTKTVHKLNITL